MSRLSIAARARSPIWWAVLAVAACGVVATAHGLYEVVAACGVLAFMAGQSAQTLPSRRPASA